LQKATNDIEYGVNLMLKFGINDKKEIFLKDGLTFMHNEGLY